MKMIHIKPEVEHRENLSKTPHLVLFGNELYELLVVFFLCVTGCKKISMEEVVAFLPARK